MKVHKLLKILSTAWVLILLAGCLALGTLAPATAVPATALPATGTPTALPPSLTPLPTTAIPTVTPVTQTPSPAASTQVGSTFTGSVTIEGGGCCMGGTAGQTLQARVEFSASSPSGQVSQMRVAPGYGGCSNATNIDTANWEPFTPSKTYPVAVAINWNTFHVSAQFQDAQGSQSPVYCAEIAVEGMPPVPAVDPTAWYPQIQCIAENEVHPAPGETVSGSSVTFSWPDKNQLPEGVFYKVSAFGAGDSYTATVATGQTRETSLTLPIPPDRAGDIVWYITLVDANGAFLDHGRCSSFPASLLTVNPPSGIKGVHFMYQP